MLHKHKEIAVHAIVALDTLCVSDLARPYVVPSLTNLISLAATSTPIAAWASSVEPPAAKKKHMMIPSLDLRNRDKYKKLV
jgi:hypothetical protein